MKQKLTLIALCAFVFGAIILSGCKPQEPPPGGTPATNPPAATP